MRASGAPIKIAGSRAGDASTLKLLRSIFTKGLEALSIECLVAAKKKGLRAELYEVLSDIDQMPLKAFMESSVLSHVIHAPRRLKEVVEAKRQMEKDDLQPLALNGVQALFQRTTDVMSRMTAGGARLRPMHDGTPMAGAALTVKTRPGDNLLVHKALNLAQPGEINVAVSLDGMVINPGDLIMGDDDGLLCVPFDQLEAIYKAASEKHAIEEKMLADIAAGVFDTSWVDTRLTALGCERS